MQYFWKIILAVSIVINLAAIWGFYHYVRYGGSPLGELKRRLTGNTRQSAPLVSNADDNLRIIKEIEDGTAAPDRIVFFGASITRRWDFEKYLPEYNIINRGVGGQLAPAMMSRFKRDALDLKPRAVIIKFCSINIRPELPLSTLKDCMTMMAMMARTSGVVPVISTIIPAGKPESHIGDFSVVDSLKAFNSWALDFAAENSYPLIDFAAAIGDDQGFLPRECSADPVHVNEKGYEILSEAVRPVLRKVLAP